MNVIYKLLLPLLIPLSWLYGIIIIFRNYCFDIGLFKPKTFNKPIISIGNITFGGTGKTPLVIYIANSLKKYGKNPGIVSRGYNRTSKGLITVHDGNKLLVDVNAAGDEPYLLSKQLKNIPIIVSTSKIDGVTELLKNNLVDIVILDDAFQHRKIQRNIDIVMISAIEKLKYYHLLPWGKMREFLYNIKRANYIIYSNTNKFAKPAIHNYLTKYVNNISISSIMKPVLMKYDGMKYKKIDSFDKEIFAFCGIGTPESFFLSAEDLNLKIIGKKVFLDHEKYTSSTLEKLLIAIENSNCRNIVTTEKDIIKIPYQFIKQFQFYIIKIDMVFENDKLIQSLVKEVFPSLN